MNRRDFIVLTGIGAVSTALPIPAMAGMKTTAYTPGLVDKLLAEGKTVFVDFATDWCTTCRAQERTISALRAAHPEYDESMAFVRVDWDVYARDELSVRLNIPRRSTLVVLSGTQEIGRIVAGTSEADIKALMDKGVKAAMA